MTIKMQPGDGIACKNIRDESHLKRIREAVRAQGWPVRERYGTWVQMRSRAWPYLDLDDRGDLVWSAQCSGRRIDPAELLGEGQTAYSILPKDTESVGHPAADILQQLADEARVNPEPWRAFERRPLNGTNGWVQCTSSMSFELAVRRGLTIRRRPRTIRIGEFVVPAPVREAPAAGTEYWVADPALKDFCHHYSWSDDSGENAWLCRGLIHLDPKAAETHGRALASLTAQEEQNNA